MLRHDFRTFGVEQEHFVFHHSGQVPSHQEIDRFYDSLQVAGWALVVNDDRQVLAATLSTARGEVVISNDFATHVLEVAFPPLADLSVFAEIFQAVFGQVVDALAVQQLSIQYGGCLKSPPTEMLLRGNLSDPDCLRMEELLDRESMGCKLFAAEMPGMVCSTQVSMDRPENAEVLLPRLAKFEFLVPLLFSNSGEFLHGSAHCIRPLAIFDNLRCNDDRNRLVSLPDQEYQYPLIRLCSNRIEFRSACSQPDIASILELIQLRQCQCHVSLSANASGPDLANSFAHFVAGCEGKLNSQMRYVANELFSSNHDLRELLEPRLELLLSKTQIVSD